MELIYERGLNCHLACIVTIAAALGIDYEQAFSNLWSEAEFSYHPKHQIYLSTRVLENLAHLGMRTEPFSCATAQERIQLLSQLEDGELFVVGMDYFYMPWHPVYQHFHGVHYMIAQKADSPFLPCFDPVYNEKNVDIPLASIQQHAFEIIRLTKCAKKMMITTLWQEAHELLRIHPQLHNTLQIEIEASTSQNPATIYSLIRRIDAMIHNRRLFGRYFRHLPAFSACGERFFDAAFFSEWEAVKNGLYKILILKNDRTIVSLVSDAFQEISQQEAFMAQRILEATCKPDQRIV